MKVNNQAYRTIWSQDPSTVYIIDQRQLPHRFVIETLTTLDDVAYAIKEMLVRGAGLIGVTASFGMVLATHALTHETLPHVAFMQRLAQAGDLLKATRPTAVNLEYAVNRQLHALAHVEDAQAKLACAFELAQQMADEDAEMCRAIGQHGVSLIRAISERKQGETVNILTHCNAGWLAFVDYGSATAPIYAAHDSGVKVHVWVDETRPRNQGARLTAWELGQHGVPHTIIADNVGGHLMQHGQVDMVIVGADRVTVTGDVANKIGTYLKALAAHDNGVPFYTALPSSTFDWHMRDGVASIPIEQRGEDEVHWMDGVDHDGNIQQVRITPAHSPATNYGFDVTPSRLVSGLITERGICPPTESAIRTLYADKVSS